MDQFLHCCFRYTVRIHQQARQRIRWRGEPQQAAFRPLAAPGGGPRVRSRAKTVYPKLQTRELYGHECSIFRRPFVDQRPDHVTTGGVILFDAVVSSAHHCFCATILNRLDYAAVSSLIRTITIVIPRVELTRKSPRSGCRPQAVLHWYCVHRAAGNSAGMRHPARAWWFRLRAAARPQTGRPRPARFRRASRRRAHEHRGSSRVSSGTHPDPIIS